MLSFVVGVLLLLNPIAQQDTLEIVEVVELELDVECPPSCSLDEIIRQASSLYGVSSSRLACLVRRESTNNPYASNGPYYGYTQFDLTTWNLTSYRDYSRSNGWANIMAAAELISRGEGSRWPIWRYC